MKINILRELSLALQNSPFEGVLIEIEIPKFKEHGDYATPIAYALAKKKRENPIKIASELCQYLQEISFFKTNFVITCLQGYINFRLQDHYLLKLSKSELSFPKLDKKILIEYVSANPTGPLHIGHGRWAVLGSTLAAILHYVGYDVFTEFYVNDAGHQIALLHASVDAIRANKPIPENGYHGSYIKALATSSKEPNLTMKDLQKNTLDRLGVQFDAWFSEKSLHHSEAIAEALQKLEEKGVTYSQDNALWFKSTLFGDDKDRVLRKSDGQLTYFAVDVAYHLNKISRGFDQLINIWGADHHGYVARVKAAVEALQTKPIDFLIIIGQLVCLMKNGEPIKMSKRTGEMITLEEVINDIGIDATRFYLIQKHHDTQIDFDLDLAVKKSNENPVFYIQYAYARLCNILKKIPHHAKEINFTILNEAERQLLLSGLKLNEECWDIAHNFCLNRLATFAIEYAKAFHYFYETSPILGQPDDIVQKRIYLLLFTQKTMLKCFALLGISAPENM